MNQLPHNWANWEVFQLRLTGFICWAEPAPENPSEERYAIAQPEKNGGLVWVRISPNPDVRTEYSGGCFYDIPEEKREALQWAIDSAKRHKQKILALNEGTP